MVCIVGNTDPDFKEKSDLPVEVQGVGKKRPLQNLSLISQNWEFVIARKSLFWRVWLRIIGAVTIKMHDARLAVDNPMYAPFFT